MIDTLKQWSAVAQTNPTQETTISLYRRMALNIDIREALLPRIRII